MFTDDFLKIVEDDDKFHAKSIGLLVLTAKILSLTLPKSDVFNPYVFAERKLSLTLKTPSEIRFWQVLHVLESNQRWALDIQTPAA